MLVCVVLTSGALFGMAAQTALDHYGLDLASVRDHLIVQQVAHGRSALAWWAWWFVAVAAFFVGPLTAAATRYLIAYWWLLRGVRLLVSVAFMLGLAAIGQLPAAPSTFDIRAGTAAGIVVALMSAALAVLGAYAIGGRRRRAGLPGPGHAHGRDFDPVPVPLPRRGGGSVDSGVVVRRLRPAHGLVPGLRRRGRLALAGLLALAVLAAVSALSGAGVALELVAPNAIRELVAGAPPWAADRPVRTVQADETQRRATRSRTIGFAPLPPDEGAHPHIAILATIPEGELTFAQGFVRRHAAREAAEQRAAQQAADIVLAAMQFQIKVPDKLRRRAVTLQRAEQAGGSRRNLSTDRVATNREARERHHGDRFHVAGHARKGAAHRRYALHDSPLTHRHRVAHAGHGRHGDPDRYVRHDDFRFAGF